MAPVALWGGRLSDLQEEGRDEGTEGCWTWLRASGLGGWADGRAETGRTGGVARCYGRVMRLFGDLAISRDCDASKERAVKAVGGRGLESGWQTRKENL